MSTATSTTSLDRHLQLLGACDEAINWANGKTLTEAWQSCERADWMLWLAGRMTDTVNWPTRQQIVLVACSIAESVLPIFEKKYPDDKRVRECIEVARKWARGEATIEEVCKARDAADAAYAAAYAAYAADAAAAYAYAAAAAAYATAYAAYAAAAYAATAYAAAAAAAYAAKISKHKKMCDLIRRKLMIPESF